MNFIQKEIATFKEEVSTIMRQNSQYVEDEPFFIPEKLEIEKQILAIKDVPIDTFANIPTEALQQTESIKLTFYKELLALQKEKVAKRERNIRATQKINHDQLAFFQFYEELLRQELTIYLDFEERVEQCKHRLAQIAKMDSFKGDLSPTLAEEISQLKNLLNRVEVKEFFESYSQNFVSDIEIEKLLTFHEELRSQKIMGSMAKWDHWGLRLKLSCKLLEKVDEAYEKEIHGQ